MKRPRYYWEPVEHEDDDDDDDEHDTDEDDDITHDYSMRDQHDGEPDYSREDHDFDKEPEVYIPDGFGGEPFPFLDLDDEQYPDEFEGDQ